MSRARNPGGFLYVHDCGGRLDLIEQGVAAYFSPGEVIDALYVSHFDEDHVAGLEHLLAHHRVQRAFIPVLHDNARLYFLATNLAKGALSATLEAFIRDTRAWLVRAGVAEVREIPDDPDPARLDPEIVDLDRDGGVDHTPPARPAAATLNLSVGGGKRPSMAIWQLKTFCAIDQDKHFRTKLATHFRKRFRSDAKAIEWLLSGAVGTKQIKDFFVKEYAGDHNRVSLCLYSGPTTKLNDRWTVDTTLISWTWLTGKSSRMRVGWMHTADYPFRVKKLARKFTTYFKPQLDDVSVFMLSHHGSASDFDETLLDQMKHVEIGLVPVGSKKQYGHPDDNALATLLRRRIAPALVMDERSDRFIMHTRLSHP
ncbi:ComEC/Rec2 family competence protein [Burkholderia alba]|uniref:hypothetical protein n=1 Tax=Burkholderia alba TaxID=2683677 RepID=UPI002B05FC23|nr:hypothetical protein [Burkholderia alba]